MPKPSAKLSVWNLSLVGLAASSAFVAVAHTQLAAGVFFFFVLVVFLQAVFRSTEPDKWRPL